MSSSRLGMIFFFLALLGTAAAAWQVEPAAQLPPLRRIWLETEEIPAAWRTKEPTVTVPLREFERIWDAANHPTPARPAVLQRMNLLSWCDGSNLVGSGTFDFDAGSAALSLFPLRAALPPLLRPPQWDHGAAAVGGWHEAWGECLEVPGPGRARLSCVWNLRGQQLADGMRFRLPLPTAPTGHLLVRTPAGSHLELAETNATQHPRARLVVDSTWGRLWLIPLGMRTAGALELKVLSGHDHALPPQGLPILQQEMQVDADGGRVRLRVVNAVEGGLPRRWRLHPRFQLHRIRAETPAARLHWLTDAADATAVTLLGVEELPPGAAIELEGFLRLEDDAEFELSVLQPLDVPRWLVRYSVQLPHEATIQWLSKPAAQVVPTVAVVPAGRQETWEWDGGVLNTSTPSPRLKIVQVDWDWSCWQEIHLGIQPTGVRQAARLTWRCHRGRTLAVRVEIPAPWALESVQAGSTGRLADWEVSATSAGKQIATLRLAAPLTAGDTFTAELRLRAAPPAQGWAGEHTFELVQPPQCRALAGILGFSADRSTASGQRPAVYGVTFQPLPGERVMPPSNFPPLDERTLLPTDGCFRLAQPVAAVRVRLEPLPAALASNVELRATEDRLQYDLRLEPALGSVQRVPLRFNHPPPALAWQLRSGGNRLESPQRIDELNYQLVFSEPIREPLELRAVGQPNSELPVPLLVVSHSGRSESRLLFGTAGAAETGSWQRYDAGSPSPAWPRRNELVAAAPNARTRGPAEVFIKVDPEVGIEVAIAVEYADGVAPRSAVSVPATASALAVSWQGGPAQPLEPLHVGTNQFLPSTEGRLHLRYRLPPSTDHAAVAELLPDWLEIEELEQVWIQLASGYFWRNELQVLGPEVAFTPRLLDKDFCTSLGDVGIRNLRPNTDGSAGFPTLEWGSRHSLRYLLAVCALTAFGATVIMPGWRQRWLVGGGIILALGIAARTYDGLGLPLIGCTSAGVLFAMLIHMRRSIPLLLLFAGLCAQGMGEVASGQEPGGGSKSVAAVEVFILPAAEPKGDLRCVLPERLWKNLSARAAPPVIGLPWVVQTAVVRLNLGTSPQSWELTLELRVRGSNSTNVWIPLKNLAVETVELDGVSVNSPPQIQDRFDLGSLRAGRHVLVLRGTLPPRISAWQFAGLPLPISWMELQLEGEPASGELLARGLALPAHQRTGRMPSPWGFAEAWNLAWRPVKDSTWLGAHSLESRGGQKLLRSRFELAGAWQPWDVIIPAGWEFLSIQAPHGGAAPAAEVLSSGEESLVRVHPLAGGSPQRIDLNCLWAGPARAEGRFAVPYIGNAAGENFLLPGSAWIDFGAPHAVRGPWPLKIPHAGIGVRAVGVRRAQYETETDVQAGRAGVEVRTQLLARPHGLPPGGMYTFTISPGWRLHSLEGQGVRFWEQRGETLEVHVAADWSERPRLLLRGFVPAMAADQPNTALVALPVVRWAEADWTKGSWLLSASRQDTLLVARAGDKLRVQMPPFGGPLLTSPGEPGDTLLRLTPKPASPARILQEEDTSFEGVTKRRWRVSLSDGPASGLRIVVKDWPIGTGFTDHDAGLFPPQIERRADGQWEVLLVATQPRSEWRLSAVIAGNQAQPTVIEAKSEMIPAGELRP